MGQLSLKKYSLLCILGGEIAYIACLVYGTTLTGRFAEFHHSIFELMPGFTWLSVGSVLAGAITVGVWSGLGGLYIAWMHNYSLKK